jgi:hypothetical protein
VSSEPSPVATSRRVRGTLYLCLAGVILFLFTLYRGIAPLSYLASGILAGTLCLLCSLLASRFRVPYLASIGTALIFLVHIFAKHLSPDRTNIHLIQWICVTLVTFYGGYTLLTIKRNREASTT